MESWARDLTRKAVPRLQQYAWAWASEGGFLLRPMEGQRRQEGDLRGWGLSRRPSPPKPAPEVPGTLQNTPLTCNGLSWAGWRKIVQAGELTTSCTLKNRERRGDARAVTGAVNTTCAVVNCSPASFGFGDRTRVVKRRHARKFVPAFCEVASFASPAPRCERAAYSYVIGRLASLREGVQVY